MLCASVLDGCDTLALGLDSAREQKQILGNLDFNLFESGIYTFGKSLGHCLQVLVRLESFAGVLINFAKGGYGHNEDLRGGPPVIRREEFSCLKRHCAVIILDFGLQALPQPASRHELKWNLILNKE